MFVPYYSHGLKVEKLLSTFITRHDRFHDLHYVSVMMMKGSNADLTRLLNTSPLTDHLTIQSFKQWFVMLFLSNSPSKFYYGENVIFRILCVVYLLHSLTAMNVFRGRQNEGKGRRTDCTSLTGECQNCSSSLQRAAALACAQGSIFSDPWAGEPEAVSCKMSVFCTM